MPMRIVSGAEIDQCVALDLELVEAIAAVFTAQAEGGVVLAPALQLRVAEANGEIEVRSAHVPGLASLAIDVGAGFFDHSAQNLPSRSGLVLLLSATTGRPQALLLDDGRLGALGTAAAGAVAARHLAPEDARIAGILGAGVQARLQLEALTLVRPIERAMIWARDSERAAACAEQMAEQLGIEVLAEGSIERLVLAADVVVTATAASHPLIVADWLHPGLHITALGADAASKNELHPGVLERAQLVVCDSRRRSARVGELHHALDQGLHVAVTELGEITAGTGPGRTTAAQITVADLTGSSALDTATACLAHANAEARGLGTLLDA